MAEIQSAQKKGKFPPGFVPLPNGTAMPLPAIDANQRYSIDEASAYLRQSREKTYRDIREGKLTAICDGRKYISGQELIKHAQ